MAMREDFPMNQYQAKQAGYAASQSIAAGCAQIGGDTPQPRSRVSASVRFVVALNDRLASIFAQLNSFNDSRLGLENQVSGQGSSPNKPPQPSGYINELAEQLDNANTWVNAIEAQLQRLNDL